MRLPKELTTVTPLSKIIALILFISLPILGFLFGIKYQQLITFTDVAYTAYPFLSSTPVVQNNSENWITYSDKENNFSLKYPPDWDVNKQDWVISFYKDKSNDRGGISIEYSIAGPTLNDDRSDPLAHIEAHKDYYLHSTSYADNGGTQLSKENIVVGEKPAVRYLLQPQEINSNDPQPDIDVWVYIPLKGKIMKLEFPNETRSLQVFSSFKFLDQNQTE